jgi:hypothetical protein
MSDKQWPTNSSESIDGKGEKAVSLVVFSLLFINYWREKVLEAEIRIEAEKSVYDAIDFDEIDKDSPNTPPIDIKEFDNVLKGILINVLLSTCAIVVILFIVKHTMHAARTTYMRGADFDAESHMKEEKELKAGQHLTFLWYLWYSGVAIFLSWLLCYIFTTLYVRLAISKRDQFNMVAMLAHVRTIYYVNFILFFILLFIFSYLINVIHDLLTAKN